MTLLTIHPPFPYRTVDWEQLVLLTKTMKGSDAEILDAEPTRQQKHNLLSRRRATTSLDKEQTKYVRTPILTTIVILDMEQIGAVVVEIT